MLEDNAAIAEFRPFAWSMPRNGKPLQFVEENRIIRSASMKVTGDLDRRFHSTQMQAANSPRVRPTDAGAEMMARSRLI